MAGCSLSATGGGPLQISPTENGLGASAAPSGPIPSVSLLWHRSEQTRAHTYIHKCLTKWVGWGHGPNRIGRHTSISGLTAPKEAAAMNCPLWVWLNINPGGVKDSLISKCLRGTQILEWRGLRTNWWWFEWVRESDWWTIIFALWSDWVLGYCCGQTWMEWRARCTWPKYAGGGCALAVLERATFELDDAWESLAS